MKLHFLAVVVALVVPIAACNKNSRSSSVPASATLSASPSPTAVASPSSVAIASASPSLTPANRSSLPTPVKSPVSPSPTVASPSSVAIASASPSAASANRSSLPTPAKSPASPSPAISKNSNPTFALSNWYAYYSHEGNFTAKFPAKPEEQKNYSNSPQGVISALEVRYIDEPNQRIYQTGYADLPVPPGSNRNHFDIEKGLDGGRQEIVRGMGATIKSETKITQNGSPGRELTLALEKGIVAKARIFINPKNLKAYQAIIVTVEGQLDFPEGQAFLDSVKISQ